MVHCIALRELAEHCMGEGLRELEAKARAELGAKFAEFGGRISAEQFEKVGFRP
jgi:hypothetical protein